MEIDVEEVNLETSQKNNGSFGFGVDPITLVLAVEGDTYESADKTALHREKNVHNYVKSSMKHDLIDKEMPEVEDQKIKLENYPECEELQNAAITEELIIKNENDGDTLVDGNAEIVLDRIGSEFADIDIEQSHHTHPSTNAEFDALSKRISRECAEEEDEGNFTHTAVGGKTKELIVQIEKMDVEMLMDMKNRQDIDTAESHQTPTSADAELDVLSESTLTRKIPRKQHPVPIASKMSSSAYLYSSTYKLSICIHCYMEFKSKQDLDDHIIEKHPYFSASSPKRTTCVLCNAKFKTKINLDNHTVRKHPNFIEYVSYKIHECTHCTFRTTHKINLINHKIRKHPEIPSSCYLTTCAHCNATFNTKSSLDDHTIREHPDFIERVSSKIHECKNCTYKTTRFGNLTKHYRSKHPETSASYNPTTCIRCNTTFKTKINLDDHTVRKHPDLIASVSSKIHECTYCTYKTTKASILTIHMLRHPETVDRSMLPTCVHCKATFKSKLSLDDHTIRKHPDFLGYVSSKIYECTQCTYKTARSVNLTTHNMFRHPETSGGCSPISCVHCNATFKTKFSLDDHTVRKHPAFIEFISSKVHKCTLCTYRTINKASLTQHSFIHSEKSGSSELFTCVHCNATFKNKQGLNGHTIRKHPDLIENGPVKMHSCTHCAYETRSKSDLAKHMFKHPETADRSKFKMCERCDATFKTKLSLDDHIIRKHPDFVRNVSSRIHKCIHCGYETTNRSSFTRHISTKHNMSKQHQKLITCVHCNTTFKTKFGLDDHIIRQHPDFIEQVTRKLYECTHCAFKTINKSSLTRHMFRHSKAAGRFICKHCPTTFKNNITLDNHIIKKHPDFIRDVTSEIYECAHCTYKTIKKLYLAKHISNHSKTIDRCKQKSKVKNIQATTSLM